MDAPNAHAAFVINGGFEDPVVGGAYTTLTSGLTGWTIDSGSVDLIQTYWTPYEPTQSLDLDGFTAGTISQVLSTVPGTTYTLTFAFSNNPDGQGQDYNGGPTSFPPSARVTVTGSALLLSHDIWHDLAHGFVPAASLTVMNWDTYSGTFTADSSSTALAFASLDNANTPWGIALDAVSVTGVPELGSFVVWSLLAVNIGFTGWWKRSLHTAC